MEKVQAEKERIVVEMSEGSDSDMECEENHERPGAPEVLVEAANEASKELLPSKSKDRYQQVFDNFQKWKESKNCTSNSERVLLAYFSEMAKTYSASTLWARYSMLKSTLNIHSNVDISAYSSVLGLLKNKSKTHEAKQAKILTESELRRFIGSAPDFA